MSRALLLVVSALIVLPAGAQAAAPATPAPPSKADIAAGKDLFKGRDGFEAGAASCSSCHELGDTTGFGGGQLGPPLDLAGVNWTPQILSAWLMSPPASTMMPIYGKGNGGELTQRERDMLGAYIVSAASKSVAAKTKQKKGVTVVDRHLNVELLLAGIGSTVVLLLLAGLVWRRRLRSVRRAMVKAARLPNT